MPGRRTCFTALPALICVFAACSALPAPGVAQSRVVLELNGRRLSEWDEFVMANDPHPPRPITQTSAAIVQVIWGGIQGDSASQITSTEARGRLVLLLANPSVPQPDSLSQPTVEPRLRDAFAVAVIVDNLAALGPHPKTVLPSPLRNASFIYITTGVASQLLGRETIDNGIEPGTAGKTVRALLRPPER